MTSVETTRLSTKGQVVIPQAVREALGLEPGELLAVYGEDDVIVLKRVHAPDEEEMRVLLAWGERFAREHGITRREVQQAIASLRESGP